MPRQVDQRCPVRRSFFYQQGKVPREKKAAAEAEAEATQTQ